jgi:hypothetical protein
MESIMKNLLLAAAAARAPFRWTKTADDTFASIRRFCRRTQGQTA